MNDDKCNIVTGNQAGAERKLALAMPNAEAGSEANNEAAANSQFSILNSQFPLNPPKGDF